MAEKSGNAGARSVGRKSPYAALGIAVAALVAFIVAGWSAWRYAPPNDPFRPESERTLWQRFVSPIERNAFMRLPAVNAELSAVFALRGTEHVWAAGEDVILHSSDGGESWEHQNAVQWELPTDVPPAEVAPAVGRPPAAAAVRRWWSFDFIGTANAAVSGLTPPQVEEAQRLLGVLGFYNGPIDGLGGATTLAAVAEFVKARGIAGNGDLDRAMLDILRKEAGAAPPAAARAQPLPPAIFGFQVETPPVAAPVEEPAVTPVEPPAETRSLVKPYISGIAFGDERTGVAVGNRGVIATTDGGRTWTARDLNGESFDAVAFATPQSVFAVGRNGAIWGSEDAGTTWTLRWSAADVSLVAVAFGDAEHGIAVGFDGAVVITRNGGESWSAVTSATGAALFAVAFTGAQSAIAVGELGILAKTADGGANWNAEEAFDFEPTWIDFVDSDVGAAGTADVMAATTNGGDDWTIVRDTPSLLAAQFVAADRVVGVGESGAVRVSGDRGFTWATRSRSSVGPRSVAMGDARRGVAVGETHIWTTADGGKSWSVQTGDAVRQSVAWAGDRVIVVGEEGSVLVSQDGGSSWQPYQADTSDLLVEVAAAGSRAVAFGFGQPYLFVSDNGGASWAPIDEAAYGIEAASFTDAQRVVAATSEGRVLVSTDAGRTWSVEEEADTNRTIVPAVAFAASGRGLVARGASLPALLSDDRGVTWRAGPQVDLNAAAFLDGARVVGVDERRTAVSTDAGATWAFKDYDGPSVLNDVAAAGDNRAVAVGDHSTFLLTTDGGETWNSVEYARYPSPLFLLLAAGALVLGAAFARRAWKQTPEQAPVSYVDGMFVPDRPLEPGERDALGLGEIAAGISRFLRNSSTKPPLTIAVSGEWGTGKSSLMGLLAKDLKSRGFRPVWFNAWHHQRGEQLLASLYANIRSQGIPSSLTPEGWGFRWNLLMQRIHRYWFRLGITLLVSVFAFVYVRNNDGWGELAAAFTIEDVDGLQKFLTLFGAILPPLAVIVPPLFGAYRALRAFGLSPKNLLGSVSTETNGLAAQPGVRYQFAQEFLEVTKALEPHHLVIFIDDLDRCEKQHVLEVLETINFLVSAGNCYIVLGMSRRWVETCVGLAFKELAEEAPDRPETASAEPTEPESRAERRRFARQYLEKLINIEVPIPAVTDKTSAALLEPSDNRETPREKLAKTGVALLRAGALVAFMAFVVGAAWWLGVLAPNVLPKGAAPAVEQTAETSRAVPRDLGDRVQPPPRRSPEEEPTVNLPPFTLGANDSGSDLLHAELAFAGALSLVALIVVLLVRRARARTTDSADFANALSLMRPWIVFGHPTPRLLKRYLNHIRFIAMRQRVDDEPASLLAGLLRPIGERLELLAPRPARQPRAFTLSEPLLVAWSALHQSHPNWQSDLDWVADAYDRLAKDDLTDIIPANRDHPSDRKSLVDPLVRALHDFKKATEDKNETIFKDKAEDLRRINLLLEIMGGVSVDTTATPPSGPPAADRTATQGAA